MSNNGVTILSQGSKADFKWAWLMRLFQAALATITAAAVLWFGKLILASVMYLVNTLPPMQADVNTLKQDVKSLKETTATKAELREAEERVKAFQAQLKKQSKNRYVTPE